MQPKTDRGRATAGVPREELPPAPGELRLVQAFVNTADLLIGTDQLATPRSLADWLAQRGLLPVGTELTAADLERVKEVRESLRSLIAAGAAAERELVEAFDDAMAGAELRPRYVPGEGVRFEPSVAGVDGALARLAAILERAQSDKLWRRFKVCAGITCRALYYDYSTNHSAKWCRPRCGNRLSAKASRRRKRGHRR